ncbi:primosomal replication protein N [Thiohalobacter sp. IOR34]|uniref:primosomal replication protein N n=1 Tax=Thiohalobacter sp. IOR34 TaxID=3057176 RepID=UPI0025B18380|nr:primosomal replication protein N [Thiohalobacter sp. IOR34]WJW74791.1 primosomal replication protein N [Thiohalobacter sp. IOR34]
MTVDGVHNQVWLSGTLVRDPEFRHSPAGIPLGRFTLEHQSRQQEAGMPRQARLRITVKAAGDLLLQRLRTLQRGDRVRVRGFLNRDNHRNGEQRLVLHAEQIESLPGSEPEQG